MVAKFKKQNINSGGFGGGLRLSRAESPAESRRRLWTAAACCRFKVWKLASRPLPEQAPANQSESKSPTLHSLRLWSYGDGALPHSKERPFVHAAAVRPFTFCLLPRHGGQAFTFRRARAGFTLIEILVALVLLALTLVLLIYPFISATNFLGKGRTRADAQRVAAQAMDTMMREISQSLQMYLTSSDPSICAFVPPLSGTFPLQPGTTVIRYAQVWRSNLNANPAAGSPISGSWYDKFNPDPKKNLSSMNDTDSRFIARIELPNLSINTDSNSDGIPDCVDRASPADKQRFIAITRNAMFPSCALKWSGSQPPQRRPC